VLKTKDTLRPATKADAEDMARLIDMAGEGLPMHFWKTIAKDGEDPFQIGVARACREEGSFSYRNSVVAVDEGKVAALLTTYMIGDEAEPIDPESTPAIFIPLLELENLALGTQYVNVLATFPAARRQGHGTRLLSRAASMANGKALSIIVSNANAPAIRLYETFGYRHIASRPIARAGGWSCEGQNWLLMRTEHPA